MKTDIDSALDVDVDGVVMEMPSSDLLVKYGYSWKAEKGVDLSVEVTNYAHDLGVSQGDKAQGCCDEEPIHDFQATARRGHNRGCRPRAALPRRDDGGQDARPSPRGSFLPPPRAPCWHGREPSWRSRSQ